jgi:hypothetical protein
VKELLLSIQCVGNESGMAPCQSVSDKVVEAEIPTVCRSSQMHDQCARTDSKSKAVSVCALEIGVHPQRLDTGSRMSGDVHVRFCERLGVKLPRPTYPKSPIGLLMNYVGKPLTIILDNASFHKAKAIQPMIKVLAQKGLKLYFLPPYSPELNRIEKLWHKMKYELMEFKTRNAKTLEEDVCKILDGFGLDYVMTF